MPARHPSTPCLSDWIVQGSTGATRRSDRDQHRRSARRRSRESAAYRWATVFLIAGATLFYVPQVFAVEAASQEHLVWFATNLVSNANVPWALAIMWLSLAGVALVAAWFFFRAMLSVNRSMARRVAKDVRPRQAPEAMPTVTATR